MECVSYRAIKLLEHAMKVIHRVFETRIREKVKIDAMQFGFVPRNGSTDVIFTVRQMQEKYRCKRKKLYFAFVDLEQEAQLMLTTGSTRLAVSRGQQTWYHSTCYI